MAIRLIFLSWWKVTDLVRYAKLLDSKRIEQVPGNSLHINPYPKPTQVGR